jgi:hypothetical protein
MTCKQNKCELLIFQIEGRLRVTENFKNDIHNRIEEGSKKREKALNRNDIM